MGVDEVGVLPSDQSRGLEEATCIEAEDSHGRYVQNGCTFGPVMSGDKGQQDKKESLSKEANGIEDSNLSSIPQMDKLIA